MKLFSTPVSRLRGHADIPGDKSISHRSLIFGAIADGTTTATGLLTGEDVLSTAAALRQMGVDISIDIERKTAQIKGVGLGGLKPPKASLDMGNSGTSARLMMGLVAGQGIEARFIGDVSLSKRPMKRISDPLSDMGAVLTSETGEKMTLPMLVHGGHDLSPITYELPVASAQVKSSILLAALPIHGETHIIEPVPTRDHSENMLKAFGADIRVDGQDIRLNGGCGLTAQNITVPGDPSSAAFMTVAALITADSKITMSNIGMNARRNGLYETLIEMGGDIKMDNQRHVTGEPVADLTVRTSDLKGIVVPPERAASMIDEYPILFVAAAFAEGSTVMKGLHELTVKESNRLAVMAEGLRRCGVDLEEGADSLVIHGTGNPPKGGIEDVETHLDHRIAMSFLILGCGAQNPVGVADAGPIQTSFPNFISEMVKAGANFK